MESREEGKGRMIAWYWAVIAFVLGEIVGFMTIIICMGKKDAEENEKEWAVKNVLLYAEDKKETADAGTSTAAHEARKGYFL